MKSILQFKRMFLLLLAISFWFSGVKAQTLITVGTGTATNTTTTYPSPYGNWYWGARHQFIITKAELNTLGVSGVCNITKLAFNVSAVGGASMTDFTIKLKNTTFNLKTITNTLKNKLASFNITC
jgi:ABC-type uncharacterized transport system permease subunit